MFNAKLRARRHDYIVLHHYADGRGPMPLTVQAQDFHNCPTCKVICGKPCITTANDHGLRIGDVISAGVHLKRFKALIKFHAEREPLELLQRLGA